jgi:hypothetical protein
MVDLRNDPNVQLKCYRVLTKRSIMVTYEPLAESVPPYRHGNLLIPMAVTAKGREMLIQLCMTLEVNGYMVCYQVVLQRNFLSFCLYICFISKGH